MLASPAITAVVGQQIWLSRAKQGAIQPYILIHKPGQVNEQLLSGDAGYPESRVSIECVGKSAAETENLGNTVFDVLKQVANAIVDDGQSPTSVIGRDVTITTSDFDVDDYSDDRSAYRRIIDFYVRWRAP
jgi:hypothetical protein